MSGAGAAGSPAVHEFVLGVQAITSVCSTAAAAAALFLLRRYELDDTLLPGCWIVIRVDGKGFTK